ncbi:MAG TPA: hypothetical protein VJN50_03455 [Actinomycetota bacterium]|nr:hypothetical protein [Actinomycetota bacterium]
MAEALEHAADEGLPEIGPRGGKLWKPRYLVRREAWHVLDHAWDRGPRVRLSVAAIDSGVAVGPGAR